MTLSLNKSRKVTGTLRGYDQFMNIVLDDAIDETPGNHNNRIGMVVSFVCEGYRIPINLPSKSGHQRK